MEAPAERLYWGDGVKVVQEMGRGSTGEEVVTEGQECVIQIVGAAGGQLTLAGWLY
jgi:hypothetical protein